MNWQIEAALFVLMIVCALGAVAVRDLLASIILLGAFSLFMCLLWADLGAVDVAFVEAAVGAGITTVLLVTAVLKTTRESKD